MMFMLKEIIAAVIDFAKIFIKIILSIFGEMVNVIKQMWK